MTKDITTPLSKIRYCFQRVFEMQNSIVDALAEFMRQ
jgi:hypothetical protein